MKKATYLLLALIVLTQSACLKTRAQLRDEGHDEDTAPRGTPAKVQTVEPQGQYVVDELKSEITRLNGRIEELERGRQQDAINHQANAVDKETNRKLEQRVLELEQAQAAMLEVIKKLQGAAPVPETPEAFSKGKTLYEAGDFAGAIDQFSAYLKNPKAPQTQEATYLRAESYYATQQYKKAILDYQKFAEKFTSSKHVAQSLLKLGMSFESLGMKEDAKPFYQELIEKYPKSAEAKKAKAKLK